MINTKKIIALGLIAATGASMIATTTASAAPATAGGSTNVSYVPGQSTGGNTDGSVANWTVDYPRTISLNDSATSGTSGSNVSFKLFDTVQGGKANSAYTGSSTVTVALTGIKSGDLNNNAIKLKDKDNGDSTAENVGLKLNDGSKDITLVADNNTNIGSLKKATGSDKANEKSIKAYLVNSDKAKDKHNYATSLTWSFSSDN